MTSTSSKTAATITDVGGKGKKIARGERGKIFGKPATWKKVTPGQKKTKERGTRARRQTTLKTVTRGRERPDRIRLGGEV